MLESSGNLEHGLDARGVVRGTGRSRREGCVDHQQQLHEQRRYRHELDRGESARASNQQPHRAQQQCGRDRPED
jgi:hypothetical protein